MEGEYSSFTEKTKVQGSGSWPEEVTWGETRSGLLPWAKADSNPNLWQLHAGRALSLLDLPSHLP